MKLALMVPGGVDRSGQQRVIPVLLALIERLARRHEVRVIALAQEPESCEYPLLGATVLNLGNVRGIRVVRHGRQFRRLLNALRAHGPFDVLHAFWVNGPGRMAVPAGRLLHVPVVVSVGGGELVWLPQQRYGGMGSGLRRSLISAVLRKADAVTAGSRYALRACDRWRSDAAWIPLGVDAGKFRASSDRGGPPWRLLHVASLNAVKDQPTLLRALRLLQRRGVDFQTDIIGEDTLSGRIQLMARDLDLADRVHFHGFLPLEEVAGFYARADLLLQSSLHESMGAAVLEAAAAGVPTVGTDVGVVAEMAPRAAVAVPVGDPEALAEATVSLLEDDARRATLAANAAQFARSIDADWTAAQFEDLYRRLVQPGRNRRQAAVQSAAD